MRFERGAASAKDKSGVLLCIRRARLQGYLCWAVVVERYLGARALLYGSAATGTAVLSSDLDVLAVLDAEAQRRQAAELSKRVREIGFSPWAVGLCFFLQSALRRRLRLWDRKTNKGRRTPPQKLRSLARPGQRLDASRQTESLFGGHGN